jgi:hypothetical protein
MYKRHYFKWNINELIALQREYELLELTIQEIAIKHERSVKAILCKLEQEKFIQNWNEAKGFAEYVECNRELDYYLRTIDDDDNDIVSNDTSDDEANAIVSEEDTNETTYKNQINKFGLVMSVKKIFQDFSYVVNKFTNITSNNSSNNNLCDM